MSSKDPPVRIPPEWVEGMPSRMKTLVVAAKKAKAFLEVARWKTDEQLALEKQLDAAIRAAEAPAGEAKT